MKIVQASFEVELTRAEGERMLGNIERAGRTCYKSEDRNAEGDLKKSMNFVYMILDRGHESVLEHEKVTVRIVCDRGVSHEIVRHRLASYSQESTRYCNYSKDKFNREIAVIDPKNFLSDGAFIIWVDAMRQAESSYMDLIDQGVSPQIARSVLPNSLKTEIVVTANLREWRHIFKLRTGKAAHPQMREIMDPMLTEFQRLIPIVFDDIKPGT